jgi:glycogen(starch) synthase
VPEPPCPKDTRAFVRWVADMNDDMRELGSSWVSGSSSTWFTRTPGLSPPPPSAPLALPSWLVTVHTTEWPPSGFGSEPPASHIHAVERAKVRRADRVITCSEFMRSHVASVFGIPRGRITAIRNAVDPGDLEPVASDLRSLRSRFLAPARTR